MKSKQASRLRERVETALDYYLETTRSERTRILYARAFRAFSTWCEAHRVGALPAPTDAVLAYLVDVAGRCRWTTVQACATAISAAHRDEGLPSPCDVPLVRRLVQGVRRRQGGRFVRQVAALTDQELGRLVAVVPTGLAGARDRAILLVGFALASRPAELVALNVEDLDWREGGVLVTIRRSKTDQQGHGVILPVAALPDRPEMCPVAALRALLAELELALGGKAAGPIFRPVGHSGVPRDTRLTVDAVGRLVKRLARVAGVDAAHLGGHSLRAGLITAAARHGVSLSDIAQQSRHRTMRVLKGYVRAGADPFASSPAARVFKRGR